jgi:hypothetical protein
VNFKDPFGLCPVEKDGVPCPAAFAATGAVVGGGVGALSTIACTASTAGFCGFAAPEIFTGGVAAGGLIGALVGSSLDNRDAMVVQMGKVDRWVKRILAGLWIGAGQGMTEEQQRIRENRPRESRSKTTKRRGSRAAKHRQITRITRNDYNSCSAHRRLESPSMRTIAKALKVMLLPLRGLMLRAVARIYRVGNVSDLELVDLSTTGVSTDVIRNGLIAAMATIQQYDPNPVKRGPYCRLSRCGQTTDPIPLLTNPTLPPP